MKLPAGPELWIAFFSLPPLSLSWLIGLVTPLFTIFGEEISGWDLLRVLGRSSDAELGFVRHWLAV